VRVRLRPLSPKANYVPGYRVVQDEIRFESAVAQERYFAAQLRERLGNQFALHEVKSPTPSYLSVFVCDASAAKR
jgi:hypothetical protein